MKAMVIHSHGDVDAFQAAELPSAALEAGQVRIRVKAASINPVDLMVRSGAAPLGPPFPAVLGSDVSGVVAEAAEGSRFAVGDAVYGCVGGIGPTQGTYAEEVVADERFLAKKPANLGHREAAALPLVTLTVAEGIDSKAKVGPGDRVLVFGGTGGVGHIAIQWAAARGATVHATASSPEKAEIARSLGAVEVHNHRTVAAEEWAGLAPDGGGYDVVFDSVGGANLPVSMAATRLNGHLVTTVSLGEHDLTTAHMKGLTLSTVFMLIPLLHGIGREAHGAILEEARTLAESGALRPLIDARRFTLDEVGAAQAHLGSGSALGKVVVEVD